MITEQEVISSQFKKVKYDSENKILTITFKNDKRYEYYDMSADKFKEFMSAESLGKYFIKEIKNTYKYRAI